MSQKEKENKIGPFMVAWLAKDGLYIAAIMICLVACLYTYTKLDNVMDDCNDHYQNWMNLNCVCQEQWQQDSSIWKTNLTDVIQIENTN